MYRQKGRQRELKKIIEQLKSCDSLHYLMLPVLRELETTYSNEGKIHPSWKNMHIDEIADLIEDLDKVMTVKSIYSEVMKKSTYMIDMDLWIKVMELLISEGQGIF